ncbi:MAG: acylphosphatase [Acidimicrobiales bacterium]|nr:MAG: acylphosphatase [Acidimicrobiales bacterium]
MIRRRVVVEGRVQGVYFRDTCARVARDRSVSGWVRNLADGRVEAVFEGRQEDVEALIDWCRSGPSRARVTGIEVIPEEPKGERGFEVIPGWH